MEPVRSRLRLRDDDRARSVAILRAVVGCDDLVFGNGQLRERIARVTIPAVARAARDARSAAEIVLLADAVDKHVDGRRELGASTQRGPTLCVDAELHARNGIRKFKEVSRRLRQCRNIVKRDELVVLGSPHLGRRPRTSDHDRTRCRCRRRIEILSLLGRDRNDHVGRLCAGSDVIRSSLQTSNNVGATGAGGRLADRTGRNISRDHLSPGSCVPAKRRRSCLRPCRRGHCQRRTLWSGNARRELALVGSYAHACPLFQVRRCNRLHKCVGHLALW